MPILSCRASARTGVTKSTSFNGLDSDRRLASLTPRLNWEFDTTHNSDQVSPPVLSANDPRSATVSSELPERALH